MANDALADWNNPVNVYDVERVIVAKLATANPDKERLSGEDSAETIGEGFIVQRKRPQRGESINFSVATERELVEIARRNGLTPIYDGERDQDGVTVRKYSFRSTEEIETQRRAITNRKAEATRLKEKERLERKLKRENPRAYLQQKLTGATERVPDLRVALMRTIEYLTDASGYDVEKAQVEAERIMGELLNQTRRRNRATLGAVCRAYILEISKYLEARVERETERPSLYGLIRGAVEDTRRT